MIVIIEIENTEKVNIGSCVSVAKNGCTTCAHRKSEYLMTKYINVRNISHRYEAFLGTISFVKWERVMGTSY